MPNDFNPLSTGLAEAIDRYTTIIQDSLKDCQPFSDFAAPVNQILLGDVRVYAKAMLALVEAHQEIHDRYLEAKENENR